MKHFTIAEFERSATADARGIDNRAPGDVRRRITTLVDRVLDPLREAWGHPIIVTSGYRCPALNRAVSGAANSQHMAGEAADIRAATGRRADNRALMRLVVRLGLPFDQMIWEKGDATGPDWVHISFGPRNRRQIIPSNIKI